MLGIQNIKVLIFESLAHIMQENGARKKIPSNINNN